MTFIPSKQNRIVKAKTTITVKATNYEIIITIIEAIENMPRSSIKYRKIVYKNPL